MPSMSVQNSMKKPPETLRTPAPSIISQERLLWISLAIALLWLIGSAVDKLASRFIAS